MQQDPFEQPERSPLEDLSRPAFTEAALEFLRSAAGWATFLAILGFIGVGFMVLGGIGITFAGSFISESAGMPFNMSYLGVLYLLVAALYFLPVYYLYRFASEAKSGISRMDDARLTESMRFLRAHFRFLGIMVIALLGLYVLGIIAMIATGGALMNGMMGL